MPAQLGRISDRATHLRFRSTPFKGSTPLFRVFFVPLVVDDSHAAIEEARIRVAFSISRKCGNAVMRNLLRRRLREIARSLQDELTPGAYLLIARPGLADLSFDRLMREFHSAVGRIRP